jgi:hypothetical protein
MCSGGEPRAGDGGTRNADGEAERGEEGGGQAASAAGGTGTTSTAKIVNNSHQRGLSVKEAHAPSTPSSLKLPKIHNCTKSLLDIAKMGSFADEGFKFE